MSGLGLQLQNTAPIRLTANGTVTFTDILVNSDPNITYNSADGTITFAAGGDYYVSWFTVVKTAAGSSGPSFAIVTNETTPKYYTAGSGFKNGEIFGSALLTVTAGFRISLQNQLKNNVSLSNTVGVNAGISVLNAGAASGANEVYNYNMSTVGSKQSIPIGNVSYNLQTTSANAMSLTLSPINPSVPVLIDMKRSSQYDGGGIEGFSLDNTSLKDEQNIDPTVYTQSLEFHQVRLRQQDPTTKLWSLCQINLFPSNRAGRVTVWINWIFKNYAYPQS